MDMREHRHVYPLAVIAVWLVILAAWLLMGCAAKVKAVEVHDTTFVAHHDTTIIYKTAERVEVLRDTIRETITLREQGDTIKVEKIDVESGKEIEFDKILMLGDRVGNPYVDGARVVATVVEQKRDDKVLVFKKKRRQNYRRTRGHRQYITVLKIKEIKA
jgi:large subunit ribosomal protein L21